MITLCVSMGVESASYFYATGARVFDLAHAIKSGESNTSECGDSAKPKQ